MEEFRETQKQRLTVWCFPHAQQVHAVGACTARSPLVNRDVDAQGCPGILGPLQSTSETLCSQGG